MKLFLVLAVLSLAAAAPARAKETALSDILSGLERMHGLRMMTEGKTYELDARGAKLKGESDDFLRRRTPEEILASGLSTGCGDYAVSFYHLMEQRGLEVRYVDAAALNFESLLNHFDGHTAVAVKDKDSGNWILVDPTFGKIVSADWDPKSGLYEGPAGRFWIGYKGPLDQYTVRSPEELKKFYAETLKTAPKDVWDKSFYRYQFTIDDSMKLKDGTYTNPHVQDFIRRPEEMYKTLGVNPSRTVKVTLKDGGDEKSDDCDRGPDGTWVCSVSRHAAMSPGMNDWLAQRIAREPGSH